MAAALSPLVPVFRVEFGCIEPGLHVTIPVKGRSDLRLVMAQLETWLQMAKPSGLCRGLTVTLHQPDCDHG